MYFMSNIKCLNLFVVNDENISLLITSLINTKNRHTYTILVPYGQRKVFFYMALKKLFCSYYFLTAKKKLIDQFKCHFLVAKLSNLAIPNDKT